MKLPYEEFNLSGIKTYPLRSRQSKVALAQFATPYRPGSGVSGLMSSLPGLLAAADFGLLTSREEGFSNVILEGMAAGLAMIVTDVGGNAEAVVHAETGFVVPPRDPRAISDAIITLARDPEARKRLGAAARKRVEKEFSIDKCVKAHLDLYQEMLDQAEPRRIAAE